MIVPCTKAFEEVIFALTKKLSAVEAVTALIAQLDVPKNEPVNEPEKDPETSPIITICSPFDPDFFMKALPS